MQWIQLIILLQCNDLLGTQGAGIHAYVTLTRKTALSCISTSPRAGWCSPWTPYSGGLASETSQIPIQLSIHKRCQNRSSLWKPHPTIHRTPRIHYQRIHCTCPKDSRLASVTRPINVCLEIMFESWVSVQMYSHIKVSKLNQCESNNQRCLPDTTKVASCIHKIFLPCIKPYKALLLVAFSHFKSSPSSNTRADEYSCFQQLASTTHYSTIICKSCHQRRKDMCAHACITLKGWVKGAKMDRAASVASNEATASLTFLAPKQKMRWFEDGKTWLSQNTTRQFPHRGRFAQSRGFKKFGLSQRATLFFLKCWIFLWKEKNLSKPAALNEPANLHKVFSRFW